MFTRSAPRRRTTHKSKHTHTAHSTCAQRDKQQSWCGHPRNARCTRLTWPTTHTISVAANKKKRQTISAWYVHPWITFALSSFELTRARFNSTQKHMHTTHIHTQNFDNQQNPSIRMISIANSTSCEQIDIRKEKKITEKKNHETTTVYISTQTAIELSRTHCEVKCGGLNGKKLEITQKNSAHTEIARTRCHENFKWEKKYTKQTSIRFCVPMQLPMQILYTFFVSTVISTRDAHTHTAHHADKLVSHWSCPLRKNSLQRGLRWYSQWTSARTHTAQHNNT